MHNQKNVDAYYASDHHFKEGINKLRQLALRTEAEETLKWGMPVYTLNKKNVFGIARFKHHFGIWFYNGVFMDDPKQILKNAQVGKTKAMRSWKFYALAEVHEEDVLAYFKEALKKHKAGMVLKADKSKEVLNIPHVLQQELNGNIQLQKAFAQFTPYKQKEFCEYLDEAKQEKTRLRRLEKIRPMIIGGTGLNDRYR